LRQKIENWDVSLGLLIVVLDEIRNWLHEFVTENLLDELVGGKDSSVLSHCSDNAQMDKMSNVYITSDFLLIVWYWNVFWIILINPFSPDLFISIDSIWKLLEEEGVIVSELVFGKSFEVQPCLLLHPVEWLISIFNTSTTFKEHANISVCKFTFFDKNLGGHHKFESNLVVCEKTSIDVSINFFSEFIGDIVDSLLNELSFG